MKSVLELLDDGLLSQSLSKYIRDPIHGYIGISSIERAIIDTEIFQRLRRIYQLQVAYTVYPGATHTRFLHSLGVMHLAGRFFLGILRQTGAYTAQEVRAVNRPYSYELRSLEELGIQSLSDLITFVTASRIGGLIHDIGHMPFSHAFDEEIIARHKELEKIGIKNHEDTGYFIYRNYLAEHIREAASEINHIDVALLLNTIEFIMAPASSLKNIDRPILRVIRSVVKEFLYPADILDFCMRDAYFTGALEYGRIDTERLFKSSIILLREGKEAIIGLMNKAIGALRAYLYSRIWLFNNVYFHKFSRLMDYTVKALIRKLDEAGIIDFVDILRGVARGEEDALRKLALMDDFYVVYKALESKDKSAKELARRLIRRNPPLREVYSLEITLGLSEIEKVPYTENTFEEIMNIVKKMIAEELNIEPEKIIIDSPPIKFFPLNPYLPKAGFPLIDAKDWRLISIKEASAWEISGAGISDLVVLRVLMSQEDIRKTGKTIDSIRKTIGRKLIPLKESIKAAFINKYSRISYTVTM